jgi:predicted flap endonuclease-1-like 5' DNA nuclease
MSDAASVDECRRRSRMMSIMGAIVVGLVVWLLLGWGFLPGLILGVIAFFVLSGLLGRSCAEANGSDASTTQSRSTQPVTAPVTPAPSVGVAGAATERATEASVSDAVAPAAAEDVTGGTATAPNAAPAAKPAPATDAHWSTGVSAASGKASAGRGQSGLKPSAELAEEATLRDGVGSWTYKGEAANAKSVAKSAAAPAAPAPAVEPAPAATPTASTDAPEVLSAARAGGGDDLTRIKGVGPGIAKTLNELGFYHFDQIGAWSEQDIAWVDSRLKFKGRIVRDNWVDQAKAFAKGA